MEYLDKGLIYDYIRAIEKADIKSIEELISDEALIELVNTFETYDKAEAYDGQCKNIISQLNATKKRAEQIDIVLQKLDGYMELGNDALVDVLLDYGEDFKSYPENCKKTIGACVQLAKTIKIILDTPLLGEDGNLTDESANVVEIEKAFVESDSSKYLGIME